MTDQEFIAAEHHIIDLRRNGQLHHALAECAVLIRSRSEQASAWHQLAQTWLDLGKFNEELAARKTCIKILGETGIDSPEDVLAYQQAALGLATALLRQRQFASAWPYWESGRIGCSWSPVPGSKVWNGEDNGRLMVVCEGGYGDLFCFRRWLPKAAEKVAWLGLMVHRGAGDIWDWREFGVDQVVEVGEALPAGQWDWSTSILSLPAVFNVASEADIPLDRMDRKRFVRGGRKRIGFCWRAEENGSLRRIRSLSASETDNIILNLFNELPNTDVFNLSPIGKELYQERGRQAPEYLMYGDENIDTWSKTIDYISNLDFVLTVDTAVAHLAGLLQIPSLLLLPAASDWKWGVSGDFGPWYGDKLRYFRNADPLQWEVDRVVAAVKERMQRAQRMEAK